MNSFVKTSADRRRFEDVAAIVTGGANGMGRAQALKLGAEGAKVAIFDVDRPGGEKTASEIIGNGGVAQFHQVDVTLTEQVDRFVDRVIADWGRVALLFSNTGMVVVKPYSDTTDDDYQRMMDLNVKSAFLLTRKLIPHMIGAGGGTIVIMSSFNAVRAVPLESIYSVSKAAVEALAKNIAVEYRQNNIRCNAIAPAFVRTGHGLREIKDFEALGIQWDNDALASTQLRVCEPEEVADVALFAASDEASFMNGSVFSVDNGWSAKG